MTALSKELCYCLLLFNATVTARLCYGSQTAIRDEWKRSVLIWCAYHAGDLHTVMQQNEIACQSVKKSLAAAIGPEV